MALTITKNDLLYAYEWTASGGDDPANRGVPDNALLNRKQGYEVLYFINKFLEIYSMEKIESAYKIERMIHDKLPGDVRSHKNVREWIKANWKKVD